MKIIFSPVNDFVASTVTEPEISKDELKSKVELTHFSYLINVMQCTNRQDMSFYMKPENLL